MMQQLPFNASCFVLFVAGGLGTAFCTFIDWSEGVAHAFLGNQMVLEVRTESETESETD